MTTAVREERKVLTAVFADVVGSTALAERLDAEDVKLVVGEAVARIVGEVESLGGHVKDLAGDGVLAFFGAPTTREDDAERAVLCALRIVAEMEEYAREVRRGWGAEGFGVRVGAATGAVVVHNPVSNMRLGSGIAPLPAFLAAGVAVALGTDGAASNDTQNPWEVIKLAALLPRLGTADPAAWPSAATILTLASRGGHRVTGFAAAEPRAGTIADGAPADLIVFDDDPLAQLDQGSAEAILVFGAPAHRPRHVIARGRVLMRDRSLATIDEDGLRERLLRAGEARAGSGPSPA